MGPRRVTVQESTATRAGRARPVIDCVPPGSHSPRAGSFRRGRGPRGRLPAWGTLPAAVGPEILIVGDRSQRGTLIPRVQDLGYIVTPVRERELSGRVGASPAPAAVLVCLGDADAAALVDAVRRGETMFR
jgi:hypothetical protein